MLFPKSARETRHFVRGFAALSRMGCEAKQRGLGQTRECHNQLKLAGKLSSLESNCLSPGFSCGFIFRVPSPAKTGAEHYPCVYISNVLSRL